MGIPGSGIDVQVEAGAEGGGDRRLGINQRVVGNSALRRDVRRKGGGERGGIEQRNMEQREHSSVAHLGGGWRGEEGEEDIEMVAGKRQPVSTLSRPQNPLHERKKQLIIEDTSPLLQRTSREHGEQRIHKPS